MRPTMPGLLIAISLTLLVGASPLTAQWRAEPMVQFDRAPSAALTPPVLQLPDSVQSGPDTFTLVMAGVAGAGIGAIGGAYLGYHLDRNYFNWGCEHGCEDPALRGTVLGWFFGAALTTPPIVHLANGGRGELSAAYLSAALIGGAGMAGLLAVGSPEGVFFLWGAPLAQVVSAVWIERRTVAAAKGPEEGACGPKSRSC